MRPFRSSSTSWPSLEAQVAAIADDIAYDNHDVDDGLRSGILDMDALLELPIVQRHWAAIEARHPGLSQDRKQRALVRDQIGTMVGDVLTETRRRIAEAGVETIDDVRAAGRALVGFSDALASEERELKRHLYAHLYNSPKLTPVRKEAQRVVANLAAAYRADPSLLPAGWCADDCDETNHAPRHRRLHRRNDRPLRHRAARGIGRAGQFTGSVLATARFGANVGVESGQPSAASPCRQLKELASRFATCSRSFP